MKKIMIVDDNFINTIILENFCKNNNYSFKSFINCEDAISELLINDKDEYRLILMDIYMPMINGINCSKIIRNNNKFKDIRIMATTEIEDKQYSSSLGFDGYLFRPYNFEYLLEIFKKYVG